jgi:hypothetical protein
MACVLEMETVITMDKFGRMDLPAAMRTALQITRSATFRAEVMGNNVELTLVGPKWSAVLKIRRGLMAVSTGRRKFDAVDAVRATREHRY